MKKVMNTLAAQLDAYLDPHYTCQHFVVVAVVVLPIFIVLTLLNSPGWIVIPFLLCYAFSAPFWVPQAWRALSASASVSALLLTSRASVIRITATCRNAAQRRIKLARIAIPVLPAILKVSRPYR